MLKTWSVAELNAAASLLMLQKKPIVSREPISHHKIPTVPQVARTRTRNNRGADKSSPVASAELLKPHVDIPLAVTNLSSEATPASRAKMARGRKGIARPAIAQTTTRNLRPRGKPSKS